MKRLDSGNQDNWNFDEDSLKWENDDGYLDSMDESPDFDTFEDDYYEYDTAYDDPYGYEENEYGEEAYDDEGYDDVPVNEFGETEEQIKATIVRYRRKKRRRRLAVVLAILVLLGGGIALAVSIWVRPPSIDTLVVPTIRPTMSDAEDQASSPEDIVAPDQSGETSPADSQSDQESGRSQSAPSSASGYRNENRYTFLVIGMDQTEGNTDTILVGTLDVKEHWLHIVSIPRDTMVNVPWGVKKINTIYVFSTMGYNNWDFENGMDGVVQGVADIMGYEPDCWAFVDIEAFVKLVDAIGGVYYDVPVDMNYSDPTQNLEIHISKGYQWLSGEEAIKVVRFRSGYANADLGRIGTQQDFIKSVASQMLTLGNIPNLPEFYRIYDEYVDTNLSSGNIAWFITEFLKLDSEDIEFRTLPGDYTYMVGGINYGTILVDEWLEIVNDFLSPLNHVITAEDLNIIQYDRYSGTAYTTGGQAVAGSFMQNPYS